MRMRFPRRRPKAAGQSPGDQIAGTPPDNQTHWFRPHDLGDRARRRPACGAGPHPGRPCSPASQQPMITMSTDAEDQAVALAFRVPSARAAGWLGCQRHCDPHAAGIAGILTAVPLLTCVIEPITRWPWPGCLRPPWGTSPPRAGAGSIPPMG
jgi:hypothetical protein